MIPRLASSLLTSLLFAASLAAQSLQVPATISAGQTITIKYSNTARANGTVFVDIDDGDGNVVYVEIHPNANGDGSAQWIVPQWDVAAFNAPDVKEEWRDIQ